MLKIALPKLLLPRAKWLEQQQTSILSAALIITIANTLSSLAGLIRERILISLFITSDKELQLSYEAFKIAFQIPDSMFQLIVLGALSASFIPIFTKIKKEDQQKAFEMSTVVMNILMCIFIVTSIFVAVFAYPITRLRTGAEFTDAQVEIAANLTIMMLIAQIFFMVSNIFSGILQSMQRFILPALAPIIYNLGIVIGVLAFHQQLGIYSAGLGVCIGAFLHLLIQLPLTLRLGFSWYPSLNFRTQGVIELFKMAPARLFTYGMTEMQNIALGFFTTSIGALSFNVMRWGQQLMAIPIRLFGVAIGQASLPFLSEESREKDTKQFADLMIKSLHQIQFLTPPASVLLLILRIAIVRLVFGTKGLEWDTTKDIGLVLGIMALSISAQSMVQLLIRAFHALKDTKTPLKVTYVLVVVYVLASYVITFFTPWGVAGLAAVTSAIAIIELILFVWLLDRKLNGQLLSKEFILPQLKMIVVGFLMGVFLYLPFQILDKLVFNTSRTVELIAMTLSTSTIGMLAYVYFSALFDIEQLTLLSKMFNYIGMWRKSLSRTQEMVSESSTEDQPV